MAKPAAPLVRHIVIFMVDCSLRHAQAHMPTLSMLPESCGRCNAPARAQAAIDAYRKAEHDKPQYQTLNGTGVGRCGHKMFAALGTGSSLSCSLHFTHAHMCHPSQWGDAAGTTPLAPGATPPRLCLADNYTIYQVQMPNGTGLFLHRSSSR